MLRRIMFPTAFCIALLAGRPELAAAAAEPEPTPEARQHFKRGLELLKAERNAEALRELQSAYALTPKWTALVSIAIASERLERDGEAIDAYQAYLDRGGAAIDQREHGRVQRSLERLRGGLATVTLEAPGTVWIVDTHGPVVNEYGPFEGRAELRVRAGEHSFELTRSEGQASSWPVTLLAGDTATHSFTLEPELVETFQAAAAEPALEPRSHTTTYVLWGVGALAAGASAVLYLESRRYQHRADAAFGTSCPNGADPADYECSGVLANDARAANWRTATLLTGLGALGALVGGTVLYTLDLHSAHDQGTTNEASIEDLRAWLSPTGFGVSGSF